MFQIITHLITWRDLSMTGHSSASTHNWRVIGKVSVECSDWNYNRISWFMMTHWILIIATDLLTDGVIHLQFATKFNRRYEYSLNQINQFLIKIRGQPTQMLENLSYTNWYSIYNFWESTPTPLYPTLHSWIIYWKRSTLMQLG